jgi:autonomous glycyl radical cofactor GrcA
MKIWIQDENRANYRNIRLQCEAHSDYNYLGELSDDEFKEFLLEVKPDIDAEKNLKLMNYYGYLHLFVIKSS